MPIIEQTTSGELDQYDIPRDIADSAKTTTIPNGFPTEVTSVSPGSFNYSSYQYDIVSSQMSTGRAYHAVSSSSMKCNSCVAVFNRVNGFATAQNSSAQIYGCAVLISVNAYTAAYTSSNIVRNSVASWSESSFYAQNSSSLVIQKSASVFPIRFGVNIAWNSTCTLQDYESMTMNFNSTNLYPTPTHFRSMYNSSVDNASYSLSSKGISAGTSGPFVNSRSINLLWSQVVNPASAFAGAFGGTAAANILGNPSASYRYVPFSHSLDYSNIFVNSVSPPAVGTSSPISTTGLLSLLARGRDCYVSVKPPASMFKPEDLSGNTWTTGLTGDYSIFDLINSL